MLCVSLHHMVKYEMVLVFIGFDDKNLLESRASTSFEDQKIVKFCLAVLGLFGTGVPDDAVSKRILGDQQFISTPRTPSVQPLNLATGLSSTAGRRRVGGNPQPGG